MRRFIIATLVLAALFTVAAVYNSGKVQFRNGALQGYTEDATASRSALATQPDTPVRATISFKRLLTAGGLAPFASEVELTPEYLYFAEFFEGDQVRGGYRVPAGQSIAASFEFLRQERGHSVQSVIEVLERELDGGLEGDARRAVINQLAWLRARLSSPEVVPSVYAINVEAKLAQLEPVETHPLVRVIRILPPESQGEPVFPSP